MKDAPFAILHEGILQSISGHIPGAITLTIRCPYLRRRHTASGDAFLLVLKDCSRLVFTNEKDQVSTDFQEIVTQSPEILSADTLGATVAVYCSNGTLELEFKDFEIYLNPTDTLSVEDLEVLARSYWDEWDENKSLSP